MSALLIPRSAPDTCEGKSCDHHCPFHLQGHMLASSGRDPGAGVLAHTRVCSWSLLSLSRPQTIPLDGAALADPRMGIRIPAEHVLRLFPLPPDSLCLSQSRLQTRPGVRPALSSSPMSLQTPLPAGIVSRWPLTHTAARERLCPLKATIRHDIDHFN